MSIQHLSSKSSQHFYQKGHEKPKLLVDGECVVFLDVPMSCLPCH